MIQTSRRSFIAGAAALVAAPAIVRVASLMQVAPTETLVMPRNAYLTINEITREAVKLFAQNNKFLQRLEQQEQRDAWGFYDGEQWSEAAVGKMLRIRRPNDYITPANGLPMGDLLGMNGINAKWAEPIAPLALAAAAVAVAPALLEKPVTRRFWAR